MNVWKLRLSMLTTLTLIIGISTAFFAVLLGYLGSLNVVSLVSLVARAADILRILPEEDQRSPIHLGT